MFLELAAEEIDIGKTGHLRRLGHVVLAGLEQVAGVIDFQLDEILFWCHAVLFHKDLLEIGIADPAEVGKLFHGQVFLPEVVLDVFHGGTDLGVFLVRKIVLLLQFRKDLVQQGNAFKIITLVPAYPDGEDLFEQGRYFGITGHVHQENIVGNGSVCLEANIDAISVLDPVHIIIGGGAFGKETDQIGLKEQMMIIIS